jgi:hypothetical protein
MRGVAGGVRFRRHLAKIHKASAPYADSNVADGTGAPPATPPPPDVTTPKHQ